MRFRSKQKPRGVLRAGDQRKLTLLILGFGFVLFCFSVARNPGFWTGVTDDNSARGPEDVVRRVADAGRETDLQPDEFFAGQSAGPGDTSEAVTVTANRILFDGAETATPPNGIPQIPDNLLRSVRDDVIGVHSTESSAYFAGLKLASRVDRRKLNSAPEGAYALFMDSPNGSRGLAWKLRGTLRRLSAVKGRTNAFGVGLVYDVWMTTPDSGSGLVHVRSMSIDKALQDLLPGTAAVTDGKPRTVEFPGRSAPEVRFTGYFFKREGYASRRGVSLAPLFLAGGIHEILPVAVTSTRAEQLTPYLGWLTLAVCAGVVFMVWGFSVSDAAHSRTRTHELTRLPVSTSFEGVTSRTIGEMISELQSEERPSL